MQTVTATIELGEDQSALLRECARFFARPLEVFLGDCLVLGIAHAAMEMRKISERDEAAGRDPKRPTYGDMDDGIPF